MSKNMSKNKERLLWLLLLGIAAFNKSDYLLTLDALERGFREANPILAPMVGSYEFHLVKLLLVPLLLMLIWLIRHRMGERLVNYVWVPFISYFSLMVYFRVLFIR